MPRFFRDAESAGQLDARRGQLLAALARVVERRDWSREERAAFQEDALRSLLVHAFEKVPFYRDKYRAAGFHPGMFGGLPDLDKIPPLSKAELRAADTAGLCAPGGGPARLLETSGSTGKPARMHRSEASLWHFTAANTALYHGWCGGKPIGNVLYFLDPTPDGIDFALADLLRTTVMEDRILSAFEPAEALADKVAEFEPEFISTYPSTLRAVAIHLDRRGRRHACVKLLHTTSEMLTPATRALLARVFPQAKVADTYTTTEAGLVGHACPAGGGFHMAEDGVLAEITGGDPGRLRVTDLTNFATPVIRYDGLGDLCRFDDRPCGCGSNLRRIAHLEGRAADALALRSGGLRSPHALTNALDKVAGLYTYQLIQHAPGALALLAVPDASAGTPESVLREQCRQAVEEGLGEACTLDIRLVDRIAPAPGAHKVPQVVSRMGNPA